MPWRSCLPSDTQSSTQRFHDAEVALVDCRFGVCFSPRTWRRLIPPRSSSIEPVTRLSRRSDVPAYESLRIGPHTLTTPRPLRSETREGLTPARSGAPSIEKCISSAGILRHRPRATRDLVPITRACSTLVVLPPSGLALRPFTATMPCCFLQTRLSRLGPRSRPRIGLMRALL